MTYSKRASNKALYYNTGVIKSVRWVSIKCPLDVERVSAGYLLGVR